MARVPEVLIVDPDPQARFEVKRLVKQAQLEIAGEAAFGTEAVSLGAEVKPDVIICGISVPPERSLQTIEALLDTLTETPLIAYSWQGDLETIRRAMLSGARDFIVMPVPAERLMTSILSVLESEERKKLRLSGQAKALGPRGLVITVFGAKGGVGKSTVATNLGVALSSALGQSVVLIDADAGFGDVSAMLDIKPERTIMDLLQNVDRVDRDLNDYLTQHESGLWVLAGPRECLLWRSVTPDGFRKVIGLFAKNFDVVLIDTAAGLTELSVMALEESQMVLWITSSDFSSINNSLRGLDTLRQMSYPEARIRLMLNVVSSEDGVRPAKIENALGRQFFWSVPYDRMLRSGAQVGRPGMVTDPTTPGARSISELAHTIMGISPNHHKPKTSPLRRLLSRRNGEPKPATTVEGRP